MVGQRALERWRKRLEELVHESGALSASLALLTLRSCWQPSRHQPHFPPDIGMVLLPRSAVMPG